MDSLPFLPFDETLQTILRRKFIPDVAKWLLGPDETSILAQRAGSVWESALTIIFLANAGEIFATTNEQLELQTKICRRSTEVARWLLTKKRAISVDGKKYACWEEVTWDTAVVIRALLVALRHYGSSFSEANRIEIEETIVDATKWLYCRFGQ